LKDISADGFAKLRPTPKLPAHAVDSVNVDHRYAIARAAVQVIVKAICVWRVIVVFFSVAKHGGGRATAKQEWRPVAADSNNIKTAAPVPVIRGQAGVERCDISDDVAIEAIKAVTLARTANARVGVQARLVLGRDPRVRSRRSTRRHWAHARP
jgi:hypothetical protein